MARRAARASADRSRTSARGGASLIATARRPLGWLVERLFGAAATEWRDTHFRALIEHSQDTIMLLDARGIIRYLSPGRASILGYEESDRLGAAALDIVHPEDAPDIQRRFALLKRTPGASDTATMRCRHKDGSWRWIEVTGTNLLDQPHVRAIVVNYRDISDRKHAEQEHAERLRLDGALLVARTAAHQLNNALSPVVGFAELLAARPAIAQDPAARAYVSQIAAAAEAAADIVFRLQNITRLEEDHSSPIPDYAILDLEKSTAPLA